MTHARLNLANDNFRLNVGRVRMTDDWHSCGNGRRVRHVPTQTVFEVYPRADLRTVSSLRSSRRGLIWRRPSMSNWSLAPSNRVSVVAKRILKISDLRLARENDQLWPKVEKIAP
jgi:hypothetical protein